MSKNLALLFFLFLSGIFFAQTSCPQVSTYFGQVQFDNLKGVCKDTKGNSYAIGNTYNTNLPVTPGAFQSIYKNDYEAYIVKFDSCGSLIWCTYFGTSGFDSGEKIAFSPIDSSIVITGYTDGTDLVTTTNCFQATSNGNYDCFIGKFSLNGQAKWVTYFGNTNVDLAYDVCIDNSGAIIIGGTSLNSTLYTTAQSFQQNNNGATDAFLARFNKNGVLKFSTFYGGSNSEDIHALTTDNNGNIIATGGSFSNNLSTSASCHQASSNGGMEIYIIKFDSIGNRIFSTYYGGSGADDAYGVSAGSNMEIFVTGHTNSSDFYKTAVSYQTSIAGLNDNYCLKFSPAGVLIWSTLFGGTSSDNNVHCRINGNNEVLSLINTQSTDFPMLGTSNFTLHNGAGDLAIAKISSSGQLTWSSFKGGSGNESSSDLFLLHNKVIVVGGTSSGDFPVIANNYQLSNGGLEDGFITTMSVPNSPLTTVKHSAITQCRFQLINRNENLLLSGCDQPYQIRVVDVLGREVLNAAVVPEEVVHLNGLSPHNIYFISVYHSGGFSTLKFVKE
jgi:hypothetical protein